MIETRTIDSATRRVRRLARLAWTLRARAAARRLRADALALADLEPEVLLGTGPNRDAVEKLLARVPVGSRLRSAEWAAVPLALRERAQFSAGVESVRLLGEIQAKLEQALRQTREGGTGMFRDRFIAEVRSVAEAEGFERRAGGGFGSLTDVTSVRRLDLIWQQQTQQAAGYAQWKAGQDADVLDAFPAQELVRVEERREKRDWRARWQGAGGALVQGRMIALKTAGIWERISAFDTPWPPFDFGSGMGVVDVSREDAEALGLVARDALVAPVERDFNARLEASAGSTDPDLVDWLEMSFGDQVAVQSGRVVWSATAGPAAPLPRTSAPAQPVVYSDWREKALGSAREWSANTAPEQLAPEDARGRLERGFDVRDPRGVIVQFGRGVLDHWMREGRKRESDMAGRLRHLPHAVETVTTPREQWTQRTQDVYLRTFARTRGGYRGCMVAVSRDGAVRTYFVRDAKGLDKCRKGLEVIDYGTVDGR